MRFLIVSWWLEVEDSDLWVEGIEKVIELNEELL